MSIPKGFPNPGIFEIRTTNPEIRCMKKNQNKIRKKIILLKHENLKKTLKRSQRNVL